MLKTRPRSCHVLPLFAPRGGHRGQEPHAACRIGTKGSELANASSGGDEKQWQSRAAKWHNLTPLLFTIFREWPRTGIRAEDGSQEHKYEHDYTYEYEKDSRWRRSLVTFGQTEDGNQRAGRKSGDLRSGGRRRPFGCPRPAPNLELAGMAANLRVAETRAELGTRGDGGEPSRARGPRRTWNDGGEPSGAWRPVPDARDRGSPFP
jgi:hypothetical protein